MRNIFYILGIVIFFSSCTQKTNTPSTHYLHTNWKFKQVDKKQWLSARVPGEVHTNLFENNLIKDPFVGTNELDLQWISETDWEYKTQFYLDKSTLKKQHIELTFEGLDTYASVYLNDSLIFETNNAFLSWTKDVKHFLKKVNTLKILFTKPLEIEEKAKVKLPYQLPEGNRIFTRKAQFQYGWDWGPKLNTMGIWRPVTLTAWDNYKIDDFFVKQTSLNDSIANLVIDLKKKSNVELDKNLTYDIYVNNKLIKTSDEVFKGHTWTTQFQIKNPKRWWPHNIGDPYLYNIKVVAKNGNTVLDSISTKIGLRTIELINEKDSIGESFYFKVNDVPVYAKGANYIPQHSFQNQVTDKHYETLLNNVVNANMNMLRVWGGGIYEDDIFYNLCDEKGILVWQDFMFACAMYPGDKAFLNTVQEEATYNIKRLRNHPSIALWCGNNENSEGWHRWGWQDGRSVDEKEEIWNNYLKVFDSILPNTVNQLTNTSYWESSPKYGRGNPKYEFEGDAHDWWIWHDAYPFEHLEEHIPRFMSEFGMQSFPSYEAIKYINQSDSINIDSESFKTHQKHHRGFQLIREYMERDFPVPEKAEDYVYISQVLQAYGITKGIEAHRRAKPYNMGTLYWQLNDCWPVVSWSSIDFFGNWKALHYKAKKAFENLLISSSIEDTILKTIVVNDHLEDIDLKLNFEIVDFNGNTIWSDITTDIAKANSADLIFTMDLNTLNFNKRSSVLKITSNNNQWLYYFSKPKDLQLGNETVEYEIHKNDTGFTIELKSKTLQKDVFLYSDFKGHFSDNFFDLLPNETKVINFKTEETHEVIDLKIKTLNQLLN